MTYSPSHTSMAAALAEIIQPIDAGDIVPTPAPQARHDAANPEMVEVADGVTTAEALRLYEQAGTPISERSIQRYCLNGRLTATRSYDSNGMPYYLIDRAAIDTDIARIKSAAPAERLPPKAPAFSASGLAARTRQHTETQSTQVSMMAGRSSALITQLQVQLQQMDGERQVLRDQLSKKDEQIAALNTQAAASSRTIDMLNGLLEKASRFFPTA